MTNELATTERIDITENIRAAKLRYSIVKRLLDESVLKPGVHYGVIPGTGNKPCLYKAGAEILVSANMFTVEFEFIERTERWDEDNPLFYYLTRCHIRDALTGTLLANADGSCSSMESKYRYRWLWGNQVPDGVDKSTMQTKTTKNGHIQYRVLNTDIFDSVNTILKMAEKRALVAAVLIASNASDVFTQDMEDFGYVQSNAEIAEKQTTDTKIGDSGVNGSGSTSEPETTPEIPAWINDLALRIHARGYNDATHARASLVKMANGEAGKNYTLTPVTPKMNADQTETVQHGNEIKALYYVAEKRYGLDSKAVNEVLGASMETPKPIKKFAEWEKEGYSVDGAWKVLTLHYEKQQEEAADGS